MLTFEMLPLPELNASVGSVGGVVALQVMVDSSEQYQKAQLPMAVTVAGMVMEVNSQLSKA
jgi:hypothetical protein